MITLILAALPITAIVLSYVQLASILLVLILFFLGFKLMETSWSYKISKPHAWDAAVNSGNVSKPLKIIEKTYRDKVRFYNFWFQVERLKKDNVPGSFAEVGVYQGETARMIHAMDSTRKFHLFDTFEGFAKKDLAGEVIRPENKSVAFSNTSVELVTTLIDGNENIFIHQGYFPESAAGITEKFALVHLDADLYQPTLAGLNFFYPKLSTGGVIIIHDYHHTWDGVKKAVDEFIKTQPTVLIPVSDWQGSVMIVKG